ncbi:uncharacterized protein [Haliotis cracherodii]|uniref:uncharacterized protein n=1 Tax=Haliotis cracherodii TaxID=6455 RepID=UPI0039E9D93E
MHRKGLSLSVFINVAWILDFTMCSTRYYRAHMSSSMNVKLNVTPLSTFTSTSPLACTQACIGTSACRSFNTGPGGRCELLDSHPCDGRGDLVSEVGFRYFDIDLDLGDGSLQTAYLRPACMDDHRCSPKCRTKDVLGTSCTTDADCRDVTGAVCRAATCHCKPHFHARPAYDSCVEARHCTSFSANFTVTRGYALTDFNNDVYLSGYTLSTCMYACISATYLCRSFEFSPPSAACHLSSNSCSDTKNVFCGTNAQYDYYSRDCL